MVKIISNLQLIYDKLLNKYYQKLFNVDSSTIFLGRVKYYNISRIKIGKNCSINPGVFFNVSNSLVIGNNVTISANVFITTTGLVAEDFPEKNHYSEAVVIEDDVWIGAGTIILPGVTLKKGSIIGAGSVVTKDTDTRSIYVGNPAKKIRSLDEN